jgi:GR25 family glycosyltransferase involved in LPS biosynthesis
MDQIDAILYINLDHRSDRNTHILQELHRIGYSDQIIHRIPAVLKEPGALGCGLSHIKALTEALSHSEWKTLLILEDDFTIRGGSTEWSRALSDIFSSSWDVALLSYNHNYIQYQATTIDSIKRVHFSQTTSSYLIRREYIPALLQNMKEAMYDMERFGKTHENCIDIHWTKLQPVGTWIAVVPAIGYQYDNYSDIEQRVTSYGC